MEVDLVFIGEDVRLAARLCMGIWNVWKKRMSKVSTNTSKVAEECEMWMNIKKLERVRNLVYLRITF